MLYRFLLLGTGILISAISYASNKPLTNQSADLQQSPSPVIYTLDLYAWALNMRGKVGIANQTIDVSQNFSDILKQLQAAAMVWLDARQGRTDIFLNTLYSSLKNNQTIDNIATQTKNVFSLVSLGIGYRTLDSERWIINPYIGIRLTVNNTNLTVGNFQGSLNETWAIPLLGTRLIYNFNSHLLAEVAGDFGATNFSTNYSFNAAGFLAYRGIFNWPNTRLYLGYRWLYQKYQTGSGIHFYNWQMNLFGPIVGLSFYFS